MSAIIVKNPIGGLRLEGRQFRAVAEFIPRHDIALSAQSLTFMTPHVITLIVLATATQRLRPPAHDGLPYHAGEGH